MNENPLRLGPIVGHTDTVSSRVWIHVAGEMEGWRLVVEMLMESFKVLA